MKKLLALTLALFLLAACSQAPEAEPVQLLPPPAWAEDPAELSELLDGTLADAVRFAVYGSSGWDGASVAWGEAVPVYALRDGVWQQETELTPYYTKTGTPAGFLYPLADGALRARRVTERRDNLPWWRYERQEPGPVCFLATSEGVALWCETGRAIPFWNEPTPGLDPAPDWDGFTSPGLACTELAESERVSYDPAQFARYDPLTGLREIDARWTGEVCKYDDYAEEATGEPAPLHAQALAELGATLASLPPQQQKAEPLDGAGSYRLTLRSPAGETFTLTLTPQMYRLEVRDSWGFTDLAPLTQAGAGALEAICRAALGLE